MRDQEGVRKSWPFPVGGEEEDVVLEKLLPPMECPRPPLWWSHELERVRSSLGDVAGPPSEEGHAGVETARGEGEEVAAGELKVRPVCEVFTSPKDNAVSAHLDGCLAGRGKKSDEPPARCQRRRWRAPKTRSLAEFYAVDAPDVVAAPAVDDTIEVSKAREEEINITGRKEIITYKKRKRTRTSVESEYENIKRKITLKIVTRLIKVC